jgi:hypothetical protein
LLCQWCIRFVDVIDAGYTNPTEAGVMVKGFIRRREMTARRENPDVLYPVSAIAAHTQHASRTDYIQHIG